MNDTRTTKAEIDDLAPTPAVTHLASDARGIPPKKSSEDGSLFDIFSSLRAFKNICDYIGGSREEVPEGIPLLASPWWFGLWWGLLAGLILLFCGQTSKFIYIDF